MTRGNASNAADVYILPLDRTEDRPAAISPFQIPEINPKVNIIINFIWLILSPPFLSNNY